MATVRISQRLYDEIEKSFRAKYEAGNPKPSKSPELLSAIREGLLTMPAVLAFDTMLESPAIQQEMNNKSELASALNRADKSDTTEVRINKITKHQRYHVTNSDEEIIVDLPTPVKLPYASSYGYYDVDINSFDISIREEIHTKVAAAIDADNEWDDKFSDAIKQVRSILDQCNTVKQLLKVWPGAEKLLSSEVVQKLHTKVKRNVDVEKVLDTSGFDEQQANQVILTANLLGDK